MSSGQSGAAGRSVIIDPAFLGDSIFDGVLARAIKIRAPGAYVGLVVRHPYQAVARHMPHLDAIHVYDKRGEDAGLFGLSRMAKKLRAARYDRAYVVHPSPRSAWLARWAGITERRGFWGGWLANQSLTHRTSRVPGETFTQDRLRLLDSTKIWPLSLSSVRGVLMVDGVPRSDPLCSEQAGAQGFRVGLVVGSQVPTKRWPIEQAARLVVENRHMGWTWVLLGSPEERPLAKALLDALGSPGGIEDRVGEDLETLVSSVAGLDLVVAGDTGPLYVARALGVPTVGLFGPTPELRHQPGLLDRVLTVDMSCRPCSPHGPRKCPKGHHRCLAELSSDRVVAAIEELFASLRPRSSTVSKA